MIPKPVCPLCGPGTTVKYDSFEDWYYCAMCEQFYSPKQVQQLDNPDAGYLKINDPQTR